MPDLWNDRINALDMRLEGTLVKILEAAESSRQENQGQVLRVFLVGGAVRDMLLDRAIRDIDVLVEGDLLSIADRLPDFDWQFYDRFMTASTRLEVGELDLVTARREWYELPGQLPSVEQGTLEDDLKRRDFTVNTMALELELAHNANDSRVAGERITAVLHDLHNAQADLSAKILRVLHDRSFYDDPTRLYRAVRYMARLGMKPDEKTQIQMVRSVAEGVLSTLSNDRLMRELLINFSEVNLVSIVHFTHHYKLLLLGDTVFENKDIQEAMEIASVLTAAQNLCPEDRAASLFGYYCLKSSYFSERFKQSSLSRRIKMTAKLMTSISSKELAEKLGVAVAIGTIKGADDKEPTSDVATTQISGVSSPYSVRLEAFEGPMDLLLHLIHESEVDIYDIPISKLCTQYLEYLSQLESTRVDIAGEFLVMAATLLEIKSMMLLPDREAGLFETWDEADDPRTELVQKLVEYKRFKDAARLLGGLEREDGAFYTREASDLAEILPIHPEQLNEPTEIELLGEALKRVLSKLDRIDTHRETFFSTMSREVYDVEDAMNYMTAKLKTMASLTFEDLFETEVSRTVVITTFLALLEMLKLKRIRVVQDSMFSGIVITKREESDQDAEEREASGNQTQEPTEPAEPTFDKEEDSNHGTTLL